MGAVLDHFLAAGIRFDRLDGDRLRASGDLTDELRAAIRAHKPALLTELAAANAAAHFRWRVTLPGAQAMEVRFVPEATRAQVAELYPGAVCEALHDPDSAFALRSPAVHGTQDGPNA